MADDRYGRLDDLLTEALELPPSHRAAFIQAVSAGDEWLRAELESLVTAYDASGGFFEELARHTVLPVLGGLADQRDADVPAGQTVSHYRITRRIGAGGMGVVYEAQDLTLGRSVALKLLPSHLHGDRIATSRLLAEARAASRLDHPNVGTIHEAGETDDGRVYIAMARYAGETLAGRIRRGPLPVEEAVRVALQIAQGLAAAHRKGIVHRDVKPSNVVLAEDGTAKLVDFGVARIVDVGAPGDEGVRGTLPYMSPEQTRGERVDHRADIWSLGVVLYEMLTGRRPFDGGDDRAVLRTIRSEAVDAFLTSGGRIPEPLAHVIERCLRKDAEARYSRVADLMADLEAVQLSADGVRRHARTWWVVSGSLLVAVSGLLAWTFVWSAGPAPVTPGPRLAVLPLVGGPGPEDGQVAAALTTELTEALAGNPGLRVLARESTQRYTRGAADHPVALRDLGADAVLVGRVEQAGTRLQLVLALMDPTGGSVWSEPLEGDMSELPSLLRQVVRSVSVALGIRSPTSDDSATASPAYGLYLRGRYYLGNQEEESTRRAMEAFKQALNEDPLFAPAWAGLSDALRLLAWLSLLPPGDAYPQSEEAARRALQYDPDLAEAHVSLARVLYGYRFDVRRAISHIRQALAVNPSHAGARRDLGVYLRTLGDFDGALSAIEEAVALDPLSQGNRVQVGLTHYMARNYEAALEQYRRVLDVTPDFVSTHFFIALVELQYQQYDAALTSLERARPAARWYDALTLRAYIHAIAGRESDARAQLDAFLDLQRTDASFSWHAAIIHLGLGERERALDLLEAAFDARAWQVPLLAVEPMLDPLRSEPRFQALVERLRG